MASLSVIFKPSFTLMVTILLISIRGFESYYGNYYNKQHDPYYPRTSFPGVNVPGQRRGFWCNYVVKRNVSCTVSRLDRVIQKYFYICSSIYSKKRYCAGYRAKYVTRYSKEFRLQPVMIKDCCPGFGGTSCDKECFNCTSIKRLEERINKLETNQRLLAQVRLQGPASAGGLGEPGVGNQAGPPGPQGQPGLPGPRGPPGPSGPIGPAGRTGDSGLTGLKGSKGDPGVIGSQGTNGLRGFPGFKGEPGLPGPPAPFFPTEQSPVKGKLAERVGLTVNDYVIGPEGKKGEPGPKGEPGLAGISGPPGKSITGPAGAAGRDGLKGDPGHIGPAGRTVKGDTGDSGERGNQGEKGESGEKGSCDKVKGQKGQDGASGEKGEQGSKGETGTEGENGLHGIKGERGPAGIPGLPATGVKQLREELEKLKAKVADLELNRCNCANQNSLGVPGDNIFEINKKKK